MFKPKYTDRYFIFTYIYISFRNPKIRELFHKHLHNAASTDGRKQTKSCHQLGGNSPQWPWSLLLSHLALARFPLGQCWDPHRFSKMTCFIRPFKKDSKRSPANTFVFDSEVRASLSPRSARYKPSPQSLAEVCGGWEVEPKGEFKDLWICAKRLLQTNLTNQMDLQSIFVPICW